MSILLICLQFVHIAFGEALRVHILFTRVWQRDFATTVARRAEALDVSGAMECACAP